MTKPKADQKSRIYRRKREPSPFTMVALDKNNLRQKLQNEIDRFNRFAYGVLKLSPDQLKAPRIDVRKYAKYVLQEGSPEEKREILNCIDHKLVLDQGKITLL